MLLRSTPPSHSPSSFEEVNYDVENLFKKLQILAVSLSLFFNGKIRNKKFSVVAAAYETLNGNTLANLLELDENLLPWFRRENYSDTSRFLQLLGRFLF